MIVTKANPREVTSEERQRAVAMVHAGATLREAAVAFGVGHETVRVWVNAAELREIFVSPPPVDRTRKGPRKPIFVNGVRLGKMALWS